MCSFYWHRCWIGPWVYLLLQHTANTFPLPLPFQCWCFILNPLFFFLLTCTVLPNNSIRVTVATAFHCWSLACGKEKKLLPKSLINLLISINVRKRRQQWMSSLTSLRPLSEMNLYFFSHRFSILPSISSLLLTVRSQKCEVYMRFLLTWSGTQAVAVTVINVLSSSTPFCPFPVSLLD